MRLGIGRGNGDGNGVQQGLVPHEVGGGEGDLDTVVPGARELAGTLLALHQKHGEGSAQEEQTPNDRLFHSVIPHLPAEWQPEKVDLPNRPVGNYWIEGLVREGETDPRTNPIHSIFTPTYPYFSNLGLQPIQFRGDTPEEIAENFGSDLRRDLLEVQSRLYTLNDYDIEEVEYLSGREATFIRRVLNACANWNAKNTLLVLWDIDDTLGDAYGFMGSEHMPDQPWLTRPCLPALFARIKEQYPDIQHGILTSRGALYLGDFIDSHEALGGLRDFFSRDEIYSSGTLYNLLEEQQKKRQEHSFVVREEVKQLLKPFCLTYFTFKKNEVDYIDPVPGAKAIALLRLMQQEKTVTLIDDIEIVPGDTPWKEILLTSCIGEGTYFSAGNLGLKLSFLAKEAHRTFTEQQK